MLKAATARNSRVRKENEGLWEGKSRSLGKETKEEKNSDPRQPGANKSAPKKSRKHNGGTKTKLTRKKKEKG